MNSGHHKEVSCAVTLHVLIPPQRMAFIQYDILHVLTVGSVLSSFATILPHAHSVMEGITVTYASIPRAGLQFSQPGAAAYRICPVNREKGEAAYRTSPVSTEKMHRTASHCARQINVRPPFLESTPAYARRTGFQTLEELLPYEEASIEHLEV